MYSMTSAAVGHACSRFEDFSASSRHQSSIPTQTLMSQDPANVTLIKIKQTRVIVWKTPFASSTLFVLTMASHLAELPISSTGHPCLRRCKASMPQHTLMSATLYQRNPDRIQPNPDPNKENPVHPDNLVRIGRWARISHNYPSLQRLAISPRND